MRITFCCIDTASEPWLQDLQTALPQAHISLWHSGDAPADYAVVWAPPQALFDQQPKLKAAFNIGAGVDALLALQIPASTQLVRLDDAGMSVQMAEYVCHALIRYTRELDVYEADTRALNWSSREPLARTDFPVGILGLGVLGARVAQAVAQFEFPVLGWSRSPKHIAGVQCFSGAQELDRFLAGTRVLVNLLPLTPETENILNHHSLSRLHRGAYLINIARGRHLVEEDLLALLESGQVAGATLDVFRTEPLPAGHPFWTHPRITVTPHTAARTLRNESIAQIVGKIQALERGEPVTGVVDLERGY
jgi:glyoxylate/hydroxypyruvate reductase A